MVLKIDRSVDGRCLILRLSGRIQTEHLEQLRTEIKAGENVVLDLEDVKLVDVDAIRFLAECQAKGSELRNCPPFIREWILKEEVASGEE